MVAAVTDGAPIVVLASALALLGGVGLGVATPVAVASPCGLALELAAPVALAAGVVALAVAAGASVVAVEAELRLPVFPAVALEADGDCCGAGGGWADAFAALCGKLAGADVLASSQAENGSDSLAWLLVVAWARWDAKSEAVAATSDARLGILGTGQPLQNDIRHCRPATGGPRRSGQKIV